MLEISNIRKDYVLKDQTVQALKGVSICFRRSEFVSILGQSGCGKTTLLNIIGGLDRYTSGDLIIEGKSTKEFKDKDWDNYRNHRVGFVFQSYNLIPHQTILENVELALTLSGIKKAERKRRAVEVLERVGLGDKLKSKPNQLSGGQMQRVAIARALVNDPEIILADEPTGALDSKTSVQIMDILKEVSKEKLVIMVTHNPELAKAYSSRIIRLLDGELIEDSKPYEKEKADKEIEKHRAKIEKEEDNGFKRTEKKKSMSFFTALALSFKNLLTKKGRTIMVSLAGSIGIIGIALILAVSAGMTNYINRMQSESLSTYPIAVSSVAIDYNNVMSVVADDGNSEDETNKDEINVYDGSEDLKDIILEKKLGKFNYIGKDFVEYVEDYYSKQSKNDLLNDYVVSYATDMHLMTQNNLSAYVPINSSVYTSAMSGSITSTFFQGVKEDYVKSMYDVLGTNAKYPTERNEVALVVGERGLSVKELQAMGIEYEYVEGENGELVLKNLKFDDVIGKTYKVLLNDAYYDQTTLKPKFDFALDEVFEQDDLKELYNDENTVEVKITCVLRIKEDANGSIFSNGIMYTKALADYMHENAMKSTVAKNFVDLFKTENPNEYNLNVMLPINFTLRVKELEQYLGEKPDLYSYNSPAAMQMVLKNMLNVELSPEQVIELCKQVYGASEVPTGIFFYAKSFEGKEDLVSMIDAWNKKENVNKIVYTDSSELVTNMLSSIVDIISYVLIAFAGISLVVSSIMIGIITYTSVIERTKEIGVLRSVGASKKDVSRVFNAETIIIGLCAGLLGVIISGILCLPIGLILKTLTGVGGLAVLKPLPCLILILISVFLTFIAGLIPARIASKKDPVVALRSE